MHMKYLAATASRLRFYELEREESREIYKYFPSMNMQFKLLEVMLAIFGHAKKVYEVTFLLAIRRDQGTFLQHFVFSVSIL
jgi:hypothetical protein